MKKHILFPLIVVFLALFIPSCSKHNEGENYLKGILDGQPFECNFNITANRPRPIPGRSGDDPNLIITGEWPSYSLKLVLINDGNIKPGIYTFQDGEDRFADLWYNEIDHYFAGSSTGGFGNSGLEGSGSITITEISKKHVKGNFEFIAVYTTLAPKTVTNGEFSINRNE